ncbi:MAG: hypothetical protein AAB793_00075 [Patescibacteria group bacterium]
MNSGGSEPSKFLKIFTLILFILALMFVLTWAPWLDNEKISLDIYTKKAYLDGTSETDCKYNVMIAPLGRWVASCEGGYYVTFFSTIL